MYLIESVQYVEMRLPNQYAKYDLYDNTGLY